MMRLLKKLFRRKPVFVPVHMRPWGKHAETFRKTLALHLNDATSPSAMR